MAIQKKRPLEEEALELLLRELAQVFAIAAGLKDQLEPLSDEDIALGAEPLTKEQIQEDLNQIERKVTAIVLNHLKADRDEWYAAVDTVQ